MRNIKKAYFCLIALLFLSSCTNILIAIYRPLSQKHFEYYVPDFEEKNKNYLEESALRFDGVYMHFSEDQLNRNFETIKFFKNGLITPENVSRKHRTIIEEITNFPYEVMNYEGSHWGYFKFLDVNKISVEIRATYRKKDRTKGGVVPKEIMFIEGDSLLRIVNKDTLIYRFYYSSASTIYPVAPYQNKK